jgi:hypothetical protein
MRLNEISQTLEAKVAISGACASAMAAEPSGRGAIKSSMKRALLVRSRMVVKQALGGVQI